MNYRTIFRLFICIAFPFSLMAQNEFRMGAGHNTYFFKYGSAVKSQSTRYHYEYGLNPDIKTLQSGRISGGLSLSYLKKLRADIAIGISFDFGATNFYNDGYSFFSDTTIVGTTETVFNSHAKYSTKENIKNLNFLLEKYFGSRRNIVASASIGLQRSVLSSNVNLTSTSVVDSNNDVTENLSYSQVNLNIIYLMGAGYKFNIKSVYILPIFYIGGQVLPTYFGAEYYREKYTAALIFLPKITVGIRL